MIRKNGFVTDGSPVRIPSQAKVTTGKAPNPDNTACIVMMLRNLSSALYFSMRVAFTMPPAILSATVHFFVLLPEVCFWSRHNTSCNLNEA